MAKASATDAAFYGFGLVKRDPLTFAGVAIVLTGLNVYFVLAYLPAYWRLFVAASGGDVADLFTADPSTREPPDPEELRLAFSELWGVAGLLFPISLAACALTLGALYRALVFGKSKGWLLGLKLGMDELRSIIVYIVGAFLAIIPGYVAMFVGLFVAVMMAAAVGAAGSADGGASGAVAAGMIGAALAAALVGCAAMIGGFAMMIWIGVRLSLAGPASVGEGRFVIFESWSMTKGRFWTLFLAYLLLLALYYALTGVMFSVAMAAFIAGDPLTMLSRLDLSALAKAPPWPLAIVGATVGGVIGAFFFAAFAGVAARVYLDWKEEASAPRAAAT